MSLSGRTKALGDYYCPSCGILGQLVLHRGKSGPFYFYINHFKGKNGLKKRLPLRRGSKYAYSCYLGSIVVTSSHGQYLIDYPQPSLFAISVGRHWF